MSQTQISVKMFYKTRACRLSSSQGKTALQLMISSLDQCHAPFQLISSFTQHVLGKNSNIKCHYLKLFFPLFFFNSSWCGPCRVMQKNLQEFMAVYSADSKFCSIDTDYNPDSAAEFQIRSIPSTLFFKNGKLVSEIVGSVPQSVIENQIQKYRV